MAGTSQDSCRTEHAFNVQLVSKKGIAMKHLTTEELEAGLDEIRQSPKEAGLLKLIVSRPQVETRAVLNEAELSVTEGLLGDNWSSRPSSRTADKSPHPEMQLNCMNARVIALLAQDQERWPLAGDQLYL